MNQLTLRGLDKELERRIREFAEQEHIFLNKAALKLMRRGAGLNHAAADPGVIGTISSAPGALRKPQRRNSEA